MLEIVPLPFIILSCVISFACLLGGVSFGYPLGMKKMLREIRKREEREKVSAWKEAYDKLNGGKDEKK